MKFGETLYQRSIPQWAPYNVDYNSLKRLIKQRTTETATEPVSIPGQGLSQSSVWQPLDDELFPILKHEHDRAALFIRSKLGEINRRLAQVERQAQLAEQRTGGSSNRPIQQTRKYQRLVEDADSIGNDIEALSRFASAQRLALRKILKKYRKWTGSSGLHIRMNNEVLGHVPKEDDQVLGRSRNALSPDMSPYLLRLNRAITIIESIVDGQRSGRSSIRASQQATPPQHASTLSQFDFERALINDAGTRTKTVYWVHPENLDEVKVLLMRRLGSWRPDVGKGPSIPKTNMSSVVLLDDDGFPSRGNVPVARMLARWSEDDFAYIRDRRDDKQTLDEVRKKDLLDSLQQKTTQSVKQVALIKSTRECFSKNGNIARIATLETDIQIGHFNHTSLEDAITSGEYPIHMKTFPFSVLTISYTKLQTIPRMVTILDHSHLVQVVQDFSLESHAIYSEVRHFEQAPWKSALESDIRKVPAAVPKKRPNRGRQQSAMASSGPSSTEGQGSIFSLADKQSSQTSVATSTDALSSPMPKKDPFLAAGASRKARKKRKSYGAIQVEAPQRYWNEFDDDPEFNGEEAYTIYVKPDEPFIFPGSETISKAFSAVFRSLRASKSRATSWLSLAKNQDGPQIQRTGLLSHAESPTETEREADAESSSDDNIPVKHAKAKRIVSRSSRRATSRTHYSEYSALGYPQRSSRDQLLSHTCFGLHALSWMFLLMATILKSTGRRKAAVEVDAGVISGIVISLACGMFAVGCTLARRGDAVGMSEWTIISLLITCEVVWGICLGVWVAESSL